MKYGRLTATAVLLWAALPAGAEEPTFSIENTNFLLLQQPGLKGASDYLFTTGSASAPHGRTGTIS